MSNPSVQTWADPAEVASSVYHLLLENDRVRVFDVRFKPGEVAEMHGHPDHVVYVVDDAKLQLATPNGAVQTFDLKAGQTLFMNAGPHETTNVGSHEAHNLEIEFKEDRGI
ncbi:MAG TPA: cytoplasmic protein [Anaerolineae bacterium]|jgi:quercetin dioxygenase-like cupin family protein|nr:cytoplasmic protein [Anaerolineae bacterium]